MEKRLTKKDYFEMIKGICADRADIVDFCNHEIELLNRKNSTNAKSKTQIENDNIKVEILNALRQFENGATISELMEIVPYSNQKLTALVKQLKDENKVVRTEIKKKAYFKVI